MFKSLDIVKSRRQDSIVYMIFAIILIVSGFILFRSGDTSLGMVSIAIGVTVTFFAITTAQAASSTMEYRDLMKKIDNLERKLNEILKDLKKKES